MTEHFLFVGLGNPSQKYENTRHNAGFFFVEKLASDGCVDFVPEPRFCGLVAKFTCAGRTVFLLKPTTYMNRSGQAVGAISRYYKIPPNNIVVAHDELDFEPGIARLKINGGHGGHNGVRDIISHLGGKKDFLRLRIGVGHPGDRRLVLDYVLGRPSGEDRRAIDEAVGRSADLLPEIVSGRVAHAMNSLHTAP